MPIKTSQVILGNVGNMIKSAVGGMGINLAQHCEVTILGTNLLLQ
jgi:hypothetical protein